MADITWDDVEQIALGKVGLTPEVFLDLTPRQWLNILKGYEDKQYDKLKTSWEQTRYIMYTNLLPYQGKGKQLKVTDVLPFEWDKKPKLKPTKQLTKAELLAAFKRQDEADAKELKQK